MRKLKGCFATTAAALIEAAACVGLVPAGAKYSRASFLFPEQQVIHMHAYFGVCECRVALLHSCCYTSCLAT
jgi:hypothetical protein